MGCPMCTLLGFGHEVSCMGVDTRYPLGFLSRRQRALHSCYLLRYGRASQAMENDLKTTQNLQSQRFERISTALSSFYLNTTQNQKKFSGKNPTVQTNVEICTLVDNRFLVFSPFEVSEVGILAPGMMPTDCLRAGQVDGFLVVVCGKITTKK